MRLLSIDSSIHTPYIIRFCHVCFDISWQVYKLSSWWWFTDNEHPLYTRYLPSLSVISIMAENHVILLLRLNSNTCIVCYKYGLVSLQYEQRAASQHCITIYRILDYSWPFSIEMALLFCHTAPPPRAYQIPWNSQNWNKLIDKAHPSPSPFLLLFSMSSFGNQTAFYIMKIALILILVIVKCSHKIKTARG